MSADREWANGLKPGDEVAMRGTYYGRAPYEILKVVKLTATQVVTEGRRFARSTLYEIGGSPNGFRCRNSIEPVTQEVRDAVETFRLVDWLSNLVTQHGRKHPPLHVLRALKATHDAASVEADEGPGGAS